MNNNRNKITFKKILVNQKLGYEKTDQLVLKITRKISKLSKLEGLSEIFLYLKI